MSEIDDLRSREVLQEDVSLGPLTTYKAGGPAKYLARVSSRQDVDLLVASGLPAAHDVLVLGRGSNLVVADRGFDGLVIQLAGEFGEITVGDASVVAGGAVPLPKLARAALDGGLTGLEFFVGVPGSVGGAVRQNAGCFGVEASDRLLVAALIDIKTGETRQPGPIELEMEYRHSNVGRSELVMSAEFAGEQGDIDSGREKIREITRWRRDHQPGGTLNAGSVFKNPETVAAGELIDQLGLKGTSVGDVAVSEKHANFFVAGPNAKADDIWKLVNVVKDRVFELSGTSLVPEIQFIGFENDD